MGNLLNSLSRIFDDGERRALSLLDEAQRAFDNFDFDATVDSLIEKGSNLYGSFNDLMKNIKDTVSDFKVIVPFNEKKESFKYDVNGDTLTIVVTGKGTKRETKVTIPSNCIVDDIEHTLNQKKRELIVKIPKDISKDENLVRFKESAVGKTKETVDWLKSALQERAEKVAASTKAPTAKKKANTSGSKKPHHVVRDGNGRFVATKKKKA